MRLLFIRSKKSGQVLVLQQKTLDGRKEDGQCNRKQRQEVEGKGGEGKGKRFSRRQKYNEAIFFTCRASSRNMGSSKNLLTLQNV
jgi:hypothetical protein